MAKQIISQGIPLVLIVLLGSLIAACNSQPEPYPESTEWTARGQGKGVRELQAR